jgi:hypothetical protein
MKSNFYAIMARQTTRNLLKGHNEAAQVMVTVYRDAGKYVEKEVSLFERKL